MQWIDEEAVRRFKKVFAQLTHDQQIEMCTDISNPAHKKAAPFFKRYRDLTAGGYYTTPEGMKASGYVGNVPSATFEGPPIEALKHVRLA